MITIESNTQTQEEMADALKAAGITPVEEPKPDQPKPAGEETKTSEQSGAPGEKVPAETEGKSAAEAEPAGDKSQEKPQGEKPEDKRVEKPVEAKVDEPKKGKGGFQAKIDKLTQRLETAREELEMERGDKTKLRQKVDELEAQIAELKPKEPEKPAEPVKPKRPTRAEVDFDEDKYEAALAKYDDDLATYHTQMSEKRVSDALAAAEEKRVKQANDAAQEQAWQDYLGRLNKDKENIEDWDEVFDSLTDQVEFPQAAEAAILESEHPGHLTHYFASNLKELERLSKMTPIAQVREIARLELKLAADRAPKADPKTDPPKGEAKPENPPAKEEKPRAKTPDEPIAPVGGRATVKADSLEELAEKAAGGDREAAKQYRIKLNASLAKKQNR